MRARLLLLSAPLFCTQGSGGLTFTLEVVQLADAPRRLAASDLDGDRDVDLFVLADRQGDSALLQALTNDGAGGLSLGWSEIQAAGTLPLPWDVDLADTDGDGDADLLYVIPSGAPYERFNDGQGHFDEFGHVPAFALRAEQNPADLDEDGDVDLVYYEEDIIGYFGTLEGQGDGSFDFDLSTEVFGGLGSFDLARRFDLGTGEGSGDPSGDLTGDGLRDTVMASTNGLQLIAGKPPSGGSALPGWSAPQSLGVTDCADVIQVDLDGDARPDVAASVPSMNAVVVFLALPSGGLGEPSFYIAGRKPNAIASADLDLDGHVDVVVANPTTSSLTVLRGSAGGVLLAPEPHLVGRRPTDVAAADLDGDGDLDLAVACAISRRVALLFNDTL